MNFKRPYWLLLFISLGLMAGGYILFMVALPDKSSVHTQLFVVGEFVAFVGGTLSFLSSLLWMLVSAVVNRKS
ncbi:MAG: hypothetical protein ACXWIU_13660 [Limisphaerales bacterium]